MGLGGTDLAIETAVISLLSDDLSRLPHLIHLSRQAMRAIRHNLAFSLGVLALAVLLTIVGNLTPVTGALLHELSSIPVIANSARLIGLQSQADCAAQFFRAYPRTKPITERPRMRKCACAVSISEKSALTRIWINCSRYRFGE
jgi:CBS-domain-containing membrane protein